MYSAHLVGWIASLAEWEGQLVTHSKQLPKEDLSL